MRLLTQRIVRTSNGPVREVIAHHPFIARLIDSRFRVGDAEGPSLAALLEGAGITDTPLTVAAARCAERFDAAADRLEIGPADAQLIARDAVVELAEMAPFAAGQGARPRIEAVDFDGVARLIRAGETAMALGLAHESIARLAAQLGTSSNDVPVQRPPQAIDGWFGADADRIVAAGRATADLAGCVEQAEGLNVRTGLPVTGGLGCPLIFGSVSQWRCNCERPSGETACTRCGVKPGTLAARDSTFARLSLSSPGLHPGLIGRIATALDLDESAVREVVAPGESSDPYADDEALSELLEQVERKAPDLLINDVPIGPPADRAVVVRPGEAGTWAVFDHPIEMALRVLINRATRLRRLVELEAPPIILCNEQIGQQAALVAYIDAVREGDSGHVGLDAPRFIQIVPSLDYQFEGATGSDSEHAVLWLPDGSLIVQSGATMDHMDGTGQRHARHAGDARMPRYVHADRLACISQYPGVDEVDEVHGAGVRTLDGQWLAEWPADMPCAFVEKDQPEDGWLMLPTRAHSEDAWPSDRPAAMAWTPDGAWIWVGDGSEAGDAVSTCTAGRIALPLDAHASETLLADGSRRAFDDDDEPDRPAAIVRADEQWHILQPDGVYSVRGVGRVVLGFDWMAAGFSHDATRLAVMLEGGAVLIFDTETLQIVQRLAR